jgi:cathepsin A (carboxypeptidase C)
LQRYRWSERQLAKDFFAFLKGFIKLNPEYKGRKIFLTGESYAGHYIPNIAHFLTNANDTDIKLAGIAIGNGWVDPFYQYPAYV